VRAPLGSCIAAYLSVDVELSLHAVQDPTVCFIYFHTLHSQAYWWGWGYMVCAKRAVHCGHCAIDKLQACEGACDEARVQTGSQEDGVSMGGDVHSHRTMVHTLPWIGQPPMIHWCEVHTYCHAPIIHALRKCQPEAGFVGCTEPAGFSHVVDVILAVLE
jgi:hypothetical protein